MNNFKNLKWLNRGGINTGTLYLVVILVLMGVVGAQLTNGLVPSNQPNKKGTVVTPKFEAPEPDKNNLQLYTFGFITPEPTPLATQPPTGSCPLESIKTPGCGACFPEFEMVACDEKPCNSPGRDVSNRTIFDPGYAKYNCGYMESHDPALFQQKLAQPNCVGACVAKPVIYLYPLLPTFVDVKVSVPGNIIVSDPLYPEEGWKDVLAYPNGTLTYNGKEYKELFFESDVDKVNAPDNGIVIAKKDLLEKLTDATTRLGLRGFEQAEFLEYWLPVLNELDAPYILFSVVDPVEKERIDHVDISPKPDTFIAFIAYFKPLESIPADLKPLVLPKEPPARYGFTAVEWGGTIAD